MRKLKIIQSDVIQAVTNHTCTAEAPVERSILPGCMRRLDKDIKHAEKRILTKLLNLLKMQVDGAEMRRTEGEHDWDSPSVEIHQISSHS